MSFQTGLSGLNASSRSLDVIGNNIANANTTGLKSSRAEFSGLVSSALSSASSSGAGIGVEVATVSQQFTQGNISTTNNNLDVAINGSGFFQLTQPDGTPAYTRDGSFKLDKDGYVITNAGANVMGYPTDVTGKPTSVTIEALKLPTNAPVAASATTTIAAEFNLDARAPVAATAPGVTAKLTTGVISFPTNNATFIASGPGGTAMNVTLNGNADINAVVTAIQGDAGYAASGLVVSASTAPSPLNQLVLTASSVNTAGSVALGGTLAAPITSVTGVAKTAAVPTPRTTYGTSLTAYDSQGVGLPVNLYFTRVSPTAAGTDEWAVYDSLTSNASIGSLVFDTSGQLKSSSVGALTLAPAAPSAVPPFPVTIDFSKVSQYGTAFAVSNLTQDGYTAGELTGLNIGDNGVITANYSNGQTQAAGQLSLADFRNIQGLNPMGGNTWAATNESGLPVQGSPGNGKFGILRAGALEESNVDLTAELVNMMTAQRAYQANAQTIKTQDQILSTLVNLR
jgi:flagellar hook protein FlgE